MSLRKMEDDYNLSAKRKLDIIVNENLKEYLCTIINADFITRLNIIKHEAE